MQENDKDNIQIAGIMFKHGTDDFSLWIPDLSMAENAEINKFLEKFSVNGESVRGTKQDILADAEDYFR